MNALRLRMGALGVMPRGLLALLAATAFLAGLAEAGLLVLLVQLAFEVSGEDAGNIPILGRLDLDLGFMFALAAGLAFLRLALHVASSHLSARASTATFVRVRTELFEAFQQASWPRQSRALGGEMREVILSHSKAQGGMLLAVAALVVAAVNFTALVVSSLVVNLVGSLVMVLVALLLYALLRPLIGITRRFGAEQADNNVIHAQDLHEALGMALEIKVFNTGGAVAERLQRSMRRVARVSYRLSFLSAAYPYVYQTLALLLIIGGLALLYGVGLGSVESLSAVILLLIRSLSYSQAVQSAMQRVAALQPVVERVRNTIADLRANAVPSGGEPIDRVEQIAVSDLFYTYPGGRRALNGVSFEVERGEVVGIAGPSGAGKSTLMQILLRLRDPTEGALLLNGRPAPAFSLDSWYRVVAYVPQDCRLISGSIAENIRWFRPWIDDEAIERAARMAHIHDEVLSWDQGYETEAGEGGSAVSGGQRQRICLARAFADDPDLIVLDEPTSALDARSEQLVRQTLSEVRGRMTVFVIAHRESTLDVCDRVLRLDEGLLLSSSPVLTSAESGTSR